MAAKKEKQLEIFLSLRDHFTAQLGKIRRRVALWARRVTRAVRTVWSIFTSLKLLLVSIASIYVLGRLAKSFLKAAADLETYRMQMVVLYRDTDRALRVFERLRRFAAASPLETQEVVQGFVRLKAVGVSAVEDVIKELGDLSLVMNRSLGDVVAAYINPQREILVKLGIDIHRVGEKARLQSGSIVRIVENDTQKIRKAMREIWSDRFAGAMEKMAGTLNARLAVLRSAIWDFQSEVGSAAIGTAKEVVDWISNTLNKYRKTIAAMAKEPMRAWMVLFAYIRDHAKPAFGPVLDAFFDLLVEMGAMVGRVAYQMWTPLKDGFILAMANLGKDNEQAFALQLREAARKNVKAARKELEALQAQLAEAKTKLEEMDQFWFGKKRTPIARKNYQDLVGDQKDLEAKIRKQTALLGEFKTNLEVRKEVVRSYAADMEEQAKRAGEAARQAMTSAMDAAKSEAERVVPNFVDWVANVFGEIQNKMAALGKVLQYEFAPKNMSLFERLRLMGQRLTDSIMENLDARRERSAKAWQEMLEEREKFIEKWKSQSMQLSEDLSNLRYLRRAGMFDGMESVYQDLEGQLLAKMRKIEEASADLRNRELTGWAGFRAGMVAGFEESGKAAQHTFLEAKQAAEKLRGSIEDGLTNAMQSIVERTATVKDAFREMAISILKEINSIIIKLLIVRPLMMALGTWMGGFGGIVGKIGGLITGGKDSGGIVQGPALVPVGPIREAFIPLPPSQRTSEALGRTERNEVNVVFSIQAMDGKSVSAAMQKERTTIENVIIDAMSRKRSMQQAVQGATA